MRRLLQMTALAAALAFVATPGFAAHHEKGENPCAENPCGDNPCGEGENPCGDNPCEENPCGE